MNDYKAAYKAAVEAVVPTYTDNKARLRVLASVQNEILESTAADTQPQCDDATARYIAGIAGCVYTLARLLSEVLEEQEAAA